jgi:predicted hydrocarbon binding protein
MPKLGQKEFTQRWIKNLVDCMDANLDAETKMRLMECCGRACARIGAAAVAKSCQGNLDQWLTTMAKWHGGEEFIRRNGDTVHIICRRCLCDLVKEGPARLPDTFCHCTRGWMKETFEAVLGKPVDVELVESIKRGASRCEIIVRL